MSDGGSEGPRYWLFKSEPDAWSWEDQVAKGARGEAWDGVRSHQAKNNMLAMRVDDLGFFYHSMKEKAVVGTVRVIAEAHPDPTDPSGAWMCVDIEAVAPLPRPVTLADVKATPALAGMALVKLSRLSVQPVEPGAFARICEMGGLDPQTLAEAR